MTCSKCNSREKIKTTCAKSDAKLCKSCCISSEGHDCVWFNLCWTHLRAL